MLNVMREVWTYFINCVFCRFIMFQIVHYVFDYKQFVIFLVPACFTL